MVRVCELDQNAESKRRIENWENLKIRLRPREADLKINKRILKCGLGRLELGRIWESVADLKGRQPRRMDFRHSVRKLTSPVTPF